MKAEVVEQARTLLAEEGWVRDALYIKGKGYCVIGAVRYSARSLSATEHEALCAAEKVIWDLWRRIGNPVRWNNETARGYAQVDELLEEMSKEYRR